MRYDQIQDRTPGDFRRLTGTHKETFQALLAALQQDRRVFGRPAKFSLPDQLLLTLMYWREYRT